MNLTNPYRINHIWLCSLLIFSILVVSAHAQTRAVVDTSASPYTKLQGLDLDAVRWQGGFWGNWSDTVRNTTLPLLHELASDPGRGAVKNFEIAAGRPQGEYQGNNWMDAWVYKWLEAAASVYCITRDPALDREMDRLIELIATAQEDDGYLATQTIQLIPYCAWKNRGVSEMSVWLPIAW
jgi:DUF1680 family protein